MCDEVGHDCPSGERANSRTLRESFNEVCARNDGQLGGSSGDEDASNQYIVRVWDFFAAAVHIFEAKIDGFADTGKGLGHGLALGVATGHGRTNHDVAAV